MTTAQQSPSWRILLRPRWLAWHSFAVLATAGMLWLGDWQLGRALSGNELSWAYTFEWPLFTIFGIYFWVKSVRDELRLARDAESHGADGQPGDAATAGTAAGDTGPAAGDTDTAAAGGGEAVSDAYRDRLRAEVLAHGRWHGWR